MKKILVLLKNRNWLKSIAQTRTSVKLLVVFTILACGPMPLDSNEFFSLFYPENAQNTDKNEQFVFSIGYVSDNDYSNYSENDKTEVPETVDEKYNLDAWEKYLNNKIDRKILKTGLYEKGKLAGLSEKIKLLDYSAGVYLKFCDKVDSKIQNYREYWEDVVPIDTVGLKTLFIEAKENAQSAKNDFLKERYHFQYIKIGASLGNDAEILKSTTQIANNDKTKTYISDWTKSRLAGSKMATGDTVSAVYDFSQIFYNCPSRRIQAERSLKFIPDNFFEEAQKIAKNSKEKANVLALQAAQNGTDGIDIIEKIYDLEPNHELLELVFTREINKNENTFFAEKNSWNYYGENDYYDENYKIDDKKIKKAKQKAETYLDKLLRFSEKVSSEKKVKSTNFWQLSNAYFHFLKNDVTTSKKLLTNIDTTGNIYLKNQVDFLAFETADKTLNSQNETYHISLIPSFLGDTDFRTNNMKVKMAETLYNFYMQKQVEEKSGWGWFKSCTSNKKAEQGNLVKGFLALNIGATKSGEYGYEINKNQDYYADTCSAAFLEKVLSFINKKDLSDSEKKLVTYSNLDDQYLRLALVRRQISNEKYDLAFENIKKIKPGFLDENGFDENFSEFPNDIKIIGNNIEEKTPVQFVKSLADLKYKTKSNKAQDWFNYAVARYNLSYYGQAWILIKRSRSHYELQYPELPESLKLEYYSNSKTIEYFKNALNANPDKELAAKICYGGALCERNQYWVKFNEDNPEDYNQQEAYLAKMSSTVLPKYKTFFKELREKYNDTQYHKMLLNECSTFANYNP